MKPLVLCILAVSAGLPAAAQVSLDCSNQTTQLDMNFCAKSGWELSDAELNRIWKIVKPQADARGQGDFLLNQQRGWLAVRDSTCEKERDQYAGGSIAPMVYWQCMDRMTINRNAQLRQFQ